MGICFFTFMNGTYRSIILKNSAEIFQLAITLAFSLHSCDDVVFITRAFCVAFHILQ